MSRNTGKAHRRQQPNKLENLWEDLLSRQPHRVLAAFISLDASEQKAVLNHLQHMLDEPGWHAEQRLSAQAALLAIGNQEK